MTPCTYCKRSGIGVCNTEDRAATCRHWVHPSTIAMQRRLDLALTALRRIKKRPGLAAPIVREVSATLEKLTGRKS